ncbi:MAG: PAS domain S-box protein [Balneolaceae bacterium]
MEELLKKIKACSRDEESYKELQALFQELRHEADRYKEWLELLERSIRNDYDSILITELDIEEPGPEIVYVNDGFTRITGYQREEVIGKTPRILQGEKTDRSVLKKLKNRLNEGLPFFGHTVNYRKDGTEFVNQWDIHPLVDDEGRVTHWVSYQHDISERKRSEKTIVDAQIEFDSLHEEAKCTRVDLDERGVFVSANKAFREMVDYPIEDLVGTKLSSLITEPLDGEASVFTEPFHPEKLEGREWPLSLKRRDGAVVELDVTARLLQSDGKRLIRLKCTNRSLQKRIVKMLRTRTLMERQIDKRIDFEYRVERSPEGLICRWVSDSFKNITGIPDTELLNRPIKELVESSEWPMVMSHLKKVLDGEPSTEMYHIRTKNGRWIPIIDSARPYRSGDDGTISIRGNITVAPMQESEA